MGFLQSVDLNVYYFFNRFAGAWLPDHLAAKAESNELLKGGLFLAIYWYFWFCQGADRHRRRRVIIAVMIGIFLAIPLTRAIAFSMPYRERPIYDYTLAHQPFSLKIEPNLENWSAFPSDTAAYFSALAFGVAYLSRRLKVAVCLYTATWIFLPRLYLGLHYLTDIIVGAALGALSIWAAIRSRWLEERIAAPVIAWADDHPAIFFPVAFLVTHEMSDMFLHVRDAVRDLLHAARGPHQGTVLLVLAGLGILLIIAAGLWLIVTYRKNRTSAGLRDSSSWLAMLK